MTATQALFHSDFINALVIYAFLAPALFIGTLWGLHFLNRNSDHTGWAIAINTWSTEHIWLPLAKVAAIIIFVLMAYPALFGLNHAPPIGSLMDKSKVDALINVLFIVSVFLPMLPLIGHQHVLILPIQTIAASQLVFRWLAQSQGVVADVWPQMSTMITMGVMIFISHYVAYFIASKVGAFIDDEYAVDGSADVIYQSILLLLQAPLILVYTATLGQQLPHLAAL